MIEKVSLAFVSTLKVAYCLYTHSQECARLIDRARLAREGGRWLAFQDGQLMTQWRFSFDMSPDGSFV